MNTNIEDIEIASEILGHSFSKIGKKCFLNIENARAIGITVIPLYEISPKSIKNVLGIGHKFSDLAFEYTFNFSIFGNEGGGLRLSQLDAVSSASISLLDAVAEVEYGGYVRFLTLVDKKIVWICDGTDFSCIFCRNKENELRTEFRYLLKASHENAIIKNRSDLIRIIEDSH